MSDFHFVVRHALTGVILLVFTLYGVWFVDEEAGRILISRIIRKDNVVATALVSAPVFGIFIQGLYTAFLHIFNLAFTDSARKRIGARIRNLIINGHYKDNEFCQLLCTVSDDALFVWLYHEEAPSYMIEWARRRRTYHYLGMNWLIASVLGLSTGMLLPYVANIIKAGGSSKPLLLVTISPIVKILGFAMTVLWIVGILFLSRQMKRDADNMELAWVFGRMNPNLKKAIAFPTIDGHKTQAVRNRTIIRERSGSRRRSFVLFNRP